MTGGYSRYGEKKIMPFKQAFIVPVLSVTIPERDHKITTERSC